MANEELAEDASLNTGAPIRVDRQTYDSEAQEWADMIADNKIAELAQTDIEDVRQLALEMDGAIDLDMLGIDHLILDDVNFSPGDETDQSRIDEKDKTTCPACGHQF